MKIPNKIKNKILFTESCWLWQGHINNSGYGRFNGKDCISHYVHREMFYLKNGYIPTPPKVVGHLCETRNCVNPDHLTEQSQSANVRQYTKKIVACPKGHPYSKTNTYIRKTGARKCRACHKEAERQKRGQ